VRTPIPLRRALAAATRLPLVRRAAAGARRALAAPLGFEELAGAAARLAPERIAVFDYPYDQRPTPVFESVRALLDGLDLTARYAKLDRLRAWIDSVPLDAPGTVPTWRNEWIPPLDALTLASLLVEQRPATYLEIGSGTSTAFARSAIRRFSLPTRIVSIDPHPRADVDALCDEVIRTPLERAPLAPFERLGPGDLLFFDGSHRSFPGSDVTRFFLELVPALPAGITWGVHDICLPYDYPEEWCLRERRYYDEQYVLAAYLLGGAGRDAVVMPNAYARWHPAVAAVVAPAVKGTCLEGLDLGGACFWLRRAPR
jgi:hypothetical protein